MKKLNIFSAAQPSGIPTLGNYIGAIRNWNIFQKKYNTIYCIADLHAITKKQNPKLLFKYALDILSIYLSCDINPNKSIIFIQSQILEHTQLSWILNCHTYFGELKRMIQFKEKSKNNKNINIGLFSYPILMASDILLYQTHKVPAGLDQSQHIELSRTVAKRFNKIYGKIFNIPELIISQSKTRIMSLVNPKIKMSKSDNNPNNFISLLDSEQSIIKKIKHAQTDSDNPPIIKYDVINKPGVSNLLSILSELTGNNILELEIYFTNKLYEDLKSEVIGVVLEHVKKLQKKYFQIRPEENYLMEVLKSGSKKAKKIASNTLLNVKKAVGLLN
ncbi:MAG: tryptophan--tRNA ligase [Wigglesworthia glossinidia]|nr:tryptophan--tRNA ligase [Wigglesworthia glossinidia]